MDFKKYEAKLHYLRVSQALKHQVRINRDVKLTTYLKDIETRDCNPEKWDPAIS